MNFWWIFNEFLIRIFPLVQNHVSGQIKNATFVTGGAASLSAEDLNLSAKKPEEQTEERIGDEAGDQYDVKDENESKNDELQHIQPAGASHFIEPKHNIQVYKMNRLTNRNQKCPYDSSDLAGQRKPLTGYLPKENEIEEMMEKLGVVDGCYQPKGKRGLNLIIYSNNM